MAAYVIRNAGDQAWLAVFRNLDAVLVAAAAMSAASDGGAFFVYDGLEEVLPIAIASSGQVRLTGAMSLAAS